MVSNNQRSESLKNRVDKAQPSDNGNGSKRELPEEKKMLLHSGLNTRNISHFQRKCA